MSKFSDLQELKRQRAYRWVSSWRETHGRWVLFLLAFAKSCCFPIPPAMGLIPLGVGKLRGLTALGIL